MKYAIFIFSLIFFISCKQDEQAFDASGMFETEDIIVSAETGGKLMRFDVEEGANLSIGQSVGEIDGANFSVPKTQVAGTYMQMTTIQNPINGTVTVKYANKNEITGSGKPLYKIADLSSLTLRAYMTGTQLGQVKVGQKVKILVDTDADKSHTLTGRVTWISDKAEFTPKTIQTKDERANLVYAMKIQVPNDGYLKAGMYGEVLFQ